MISCTCLGRWMDYCLGCRTEMLIPYEDCLPFTVETSRDKNAELLITVIFQSAQQEIAYHLACSLT